MNDEKIREEAKIYNKEPLSEYQQQINFAAGEICSKNPNMLVRRGELLEQARKSVDGSGYQYKKGKSRSKNFGSAPSKPKRQKIDHDLRTRRMKEIKEELATITKQISFKERRVETGAQDRNFKLCDQLTEEISVLQKNRRTLELELHGLEKKEKKASYYQKNVKHFSPISSDSESTANSACGNRPSDLSPSPAPEVCEVVSSDTETTLPDRMSQHLSDADTIILSNESDTDLNPLSQKHLFNCAS